MMHYTNPQASALSAAGGGGGGVAAAPPPVAAAQPTTAPLQEKWIWVLDPMTRKLRVPMSYFVPTQATATSGTVPSLCIAFLEGRCRHPWCRQAHVLPSVISQLRHDALNAPTCCFYHHDPHDIAILTSRFQSVTVTDSSMSQPIPAERIALTVGLQRYLAHTVPAEMINGTTLELPSKLICRLHLSHRCRYLEDCNNVHVCRDFDLKLHPPPFMLAPLLNLTMASRNVVLGDTSYTVTPLAAGEVSDEEFHSICEMQQKAAAATATAAGSSPVMLHDTAGTSPPMMGTPVLSFSTPPLHFAPPSSTSLLGGGAAMQTFSSLPAGFPSFAAGVLPTTPSNNIANITLDATSNSASVLTGVVMGHSPSMGPAAATAVGSVRGTSAAATPPPPYSEAAAITAAGITNSPAPFGASSSATQRPIKSAVRVYDIRAATLPAALPPLSGSAGFVPAGPMGSSTSVASSSSSPVVGHRGNPSPQPSPLQRSGGSPTRSPPLFHGPPSYQQHLGSHNQ